MLLLPYFLPFFLFLVFFLIAVAVAMAHSQSQSYEEEEGRTIIAITNAFLVLLFLLSQVLRSPIIEGPFAWLGFPSLCVVLAFISFCFTFEVFLSATHRKPL